MLKNDLIKSIKNNHVKFVENDPAHEAAQFFEETFFEFLEYYPRHVLEEIWSRMAKSISRV